MLFRLSKSTNNDPYFLNEELLQALLKAFGYSTSTLETHIDILHVLKNVSKSKHCRGLLAGRDAVDLCCRFIAAEVKKTQVCRH